MAAAERTGAGSAVRVVGRPTAAKWSRMRRSVGGRAEPEPDREGRCEHDAERHRLPVEQRVAVARERFQRVAERVAEIEQRAGAGLALIGRDQGSLGAAARHDRVLPGRVVARQQGRAVRLEPGEQRRLVDQPVFDHLGIARAQLPRRQALQDVGVRQHEPRLMEAADQVLALARVDPGLAADRAVDLGEQRGRDLHVVEPAQQDRRCEAREVADHPAAEGDQRGLALGPEVQDLIQKPLQPGHALGRLARRQDDPARRDAGRREALFQGRQMRGPGQIGVGHDDHVRTAEQRSELGAGATEQPRPDQDVVAARVQRHPEARRGNHGGHGGLPARSPGSASRMRSTTAPIGPLLLSTTRSASA